MTLLIPVSWGELLDKITILEIKSSRITDAAKLQNIRKELNLLSDVAGSQADVPGGNSKDPALDKLKEDLRRVNEALWDIEDAIRECEGRGDFGSRFLELARAVYKNNDERAALKQRINLLLGSDLVEEKSYSKY